MDREWWYNRGKRDGRAGKPFLDFTGDDVPSEWTEEDRLANRDAYSDGYAHGEEYAQDAIRDGR